MAYQREARAKHEEMQKETAEKNKKEGEAFLAENKTKPGRQDPRTSSWRMGRRRNCNIKSSPKARAPSPRATTPSTVNYRGTLINGKEFDNSAKHGGQPAKFAGQPRRPRLDRGAGTNEGRLEMGALPPLDPGLRRPRLPAKR